MIQAMKPKSEQSNIHSVSFTRMPNESRVQCTSITNAPTGGMMPIINLLAFHSQLLPRAARRIFSFRSMKSSSFIVT